MQEQAGIFAHRAGDIEQRHDRRRLVDPPEFADIDDLAAGAQGSAQRAAHVEPQAPRIGLVAAGAQFGLRQPHLGDGAGDFGDLGRAHLRKIFLLQDLLVGDRQPQFLLLDLRASSRIEGCAIASWTRREAGGGFFLA